MFASNGAIWWSSTGKYLAYAEFNDTEVQKVEFSWYGSEQYPQTVSVPYPKVRNYFSITSCTTNYMAGLCSHLLLHKLSSSRSRMLHFIVFVAGWIDPYQGETDCGWYHESIPPHTGGSSRFCCFWVCIFFFSLKHDLNQTEANTISSCSVSCENLVTFCCLLLSDHILCSVTWPTDERVAVQWLTRKQNYVIVQIYDFDGSSWKEKQVAVTSLVTYLVRKSQAVLN